MLVLLWQFCVSITKTLLENFVKFMVFYLSFKCMYNVVSYIEKLAIFNLFECM